MNSAAKAGRARIGINAHLLSSRVGYQRAGIHRYISQLIQHLHLPEDIQAVVLTRDRTSVPEDSNISLQGSRWPTDRRIARIFWEQCFWPVEAVRQGFDLIHGMAFVLPLVRPCPSVVTVYDLSFIRYPSQYPALQRLYLASQTRRSCQAARRVVAISEATRRDIHQAFDIPLEKIDVVTPGITKEFRPLSKDAVEQFRVRKGLSKKGILHVGTLQPRKNIPFLLKVIAQLNRSDTQVILVGDVGWYYEEIFTTVRMLGMEDSVRFEGYVPDSELPLWYNAAAASVFPSKYEGFGMPILEAMACGTPVIAAKTSAIPEVSGSAARLYEPENERALADHIVDILDDRQVAAKMREDGLSRAENFSWEHSGRAMLSVYQRALLQG